MKLVDLYTKYTREASYLQTRKQEWNAEKEGIECPEGITDALVDLQETLDNLKYAISLTWMTKNKVYSVEDLIQLVGQETYNKYKSQELTTSCFYIALEEGSV